MATTILILGVSFVWASVGVLLGLWLMWSLMLAMYRVSGNDEVADAMSDVGMWYFFVRTFRAVWRHR